MPEGRGDLDRRMLIRRAAIAGVAAWTAPVIIGSVASPAGALTIAPGCYRMWVGFSGGGLAWPAWQATPPATACSPALPSSCSPGDSTVPAAAVTISPSVQPADVSTTPVTITVGEGCSIVSASAMVKTTFQLVQACRTATTSGTVGSTTFTFTANSVTITPNGPVSNDVWDQETILHPRSNIGIVVTCP